MKKTLSFMVMAFALLFTQCRKPEVKFPTPSAADEGTTVSMTVTAGPGSKTDITTAGVITWSEDDKLYVGDGTKYIGCLTLVSGQNTPTGTFSGNVTLTGITEGVPQMFHFYYLGSTEAPAAGATEVDVDFSTQEIYADANNKLVNASAQHVGYGSAKGTVSGGVVIGINVTMVSKVALARFSFKNNDGTPYTDPLILSGTGIYNKMTVHFNSAGFACEGTKGDIILMDDHGERYVMLVPTSSTTGSQTLHFDFFTLGGGTTTLENGIEANKFYGRESAIPVTVKPKFTVDANGTTVEFAPGNLYWDGSANEWKFELNQWSYSAGVWDPDSEQIIWDQNHVSHFYWSKTASVTYALYYGDDGASTDDVFFTNAAEKTANPNFQVGGETAGTWRTLSIAEWNYLLFSRSHAQSLWAWVTLEDVNVSGLVILPDAASAYAGSITSTDALATSGGVFLPVTGNRIDIHMGGGEVFYWSSTPRDIVQGAYSIEGWSGGVQTRYDTRGVGNAVRLVR